MIVPHEERVSPWRPFGHYGKTHYRIRQRLTLFGMFQRHEWLTEGGTQECDRWIRGSGLNWVSEASATNDPALDEAGVLLRAIQRIADGHNDPRGLAIETLTQIGTEA